MTGDSWTDSGTRGTSVLTVSRVAGRADDPFFHSFAKPNVVLHSANRFVASPRCEPSEVLIYVADVACMTIAAISRLPF
jgi:hypothetical protein